MSDELENVGAGSETSGEQSVDVSSQEQNNVKGPFTDSTIDTGTASQDAGAQDAGSAVEQATANPNPVAAGDTCVCPDGRTGTVHQFDEGLICIPNADQG